MIWLPFIAKVKEFCRCNLGLQLVDLMLIKRRPFWMCLTQPVGSLKESLEVKVKRLERWEITSDVFYWPQGNKLSCCGEAMGQEMVGGIYLLTVALADSQQECGDLSCAIIRNWSLPTATHIWNRTLSFDINLWDPEYRLHSSWGHTSDPQQVS